mmetsp:Transcript_6970/g.15121  ORF Transcript_6970/g.15121 Transcript_6970/m.15121 type:complete len:302 (+) Transcript_6970:735-1640(+)
MRTIPSHPTIAIITTSKRMPTKISGSKGNWSRGNMITIAMVFPLPLLRRRTRKWESWPGTFDWERGIRMHTRRKRVPLLLPGEEAERVGGGPVPRSSPGNYPWTLTKYPSDPPTPNEMGDTLTTRLPPRDCYYDITATTTIPTAFRPPSPLLLLPPLPMSTSMPTIPSPRATAPATPCKAIGPRRTPIRRLMPREDPPGIITSIRSGFCPNWGWSWGKRIIASRGSSVRGRGWRNCSIISIGWIRREGILIIVMVNGIVMVLLQPIILVNRVNRMMFEEIPTPTTRTKINEVTKASFPYRP